MICNKLKKVILRKICVIRNNLYSYFSWIFDQSKKGGERGKITHRIRHMMCVNATFRPHRQKIVYDVRVTKNNFLLGGTNMAGAIAVTPEQLKSQAKVYQQAASQIQDAIRKVNSMNQQIAQQWKGQAFQAYLEQYNQLEGNVKQMEQLLESINQQLNKYADTVAERDRQDAGLFGF